MILLEKDIERKLVEMVKRCGGMCLKWVCPGWSGVPDRIVLLPGARVIFAELKRPGGQPTRIQKWWANKLRSLGFMHIYIKTAADVDLLERFIHEEGTPCLK